MYRERLTITLDTELLSAVDATIDLSQIRNRSHAIEHLLREGLALHQLTQAFFFVDEEWDSSTLPKIITLCDKSGITSYYLIPTPVTQSLLPEITASILQLSKLKPTVKNIPGDFGTGGALLLYKDQLTTPFLLFDLSATLQVPNQLLPAYTFHHRHPGLVTYLLASENAEQFFHTGVSIADPDLLLAIPAGIVSLQETVFPALLKEGKVKGYVTA